MIQAGINPIPPMALYNIPNNEDPAFVPQQRQQSQYLIDFFKCLPLSIRERAPRCDGDVMAQADSIRLWMSQSEEIQTLQSLELANSRLINLPPEIGLFHHLTCLDLANNELSELPPEIGNLAALKTLNLSSNQLAVLPAEIGKLTALTELNLSNNLLAAMPAEIGSLTALTTLNLSDNQLAVLPAEIGHLTALTELDLSGNQLAAVPVALGNLVALERLDLCLNHLAALPAEIGNLAALVWIDLSNNRLPALPAEIGNLTALAWLGLTKNRLAAMPAEIGKLTALVWLDLENNRLAVLPAEIGNLAALRNLYIQKNRFAIFPPEAANLLELRCDMPRPQVSPLHVWAAEFEQAFPQQENIEYWDSRATDFAPLESLSVEEMQSFTSYLTRLRETQDYQSGGKARNNVILRVERMVQLACKNPEFQQFMLAAIAEGLESCGDQILITFNEIEVQWNFHYKKLMVIQQQRQQAQRLIEFFACLPWSIRTGAPQCNGDVLAQADSIRLWMSQSEEVRTLRSLSLINLRLTHLPPEIGLFQQLTWLGLSRNELTVLPAEIGNLAALTGLDLSHNQFTAMPVEIGNLTALTELDLSDNQLTAMPAEIGNLTALHRLDLTSNRLAVLAPEIGKLAALTILNLSNNELVAMPAEIGNLAALTTLDLCLNQLAAVPAEIGNLTALTTLVLSRNQLVAIPAEIGNLTALATLVLTHNQLVALPAEIGKLTALMRLHLRHNQLSALPAEIGSLAALRNLSIQNNPFAIFPPELVHLVNLQCECDLPRPPASPLRVWALEFEKAFPQQANIEYWDSRTMDFTPLESLPIEEKQVFTNYLKRIRETEDYTSGGDEQNNIILRVERMVQLACKNPEFKYVMLAAISDGLDSCDDRVLITFNEIEIQWQFHHKKLTDEEFKSLAIRASRYQCLTKYAHNIAVERGFGDRIETILFYHIHLREPLDLPITTKRMGHPDVAGVTPEMLELAKGIMLSYSDEHLLAESEHWKARMVAQHSNLAEEVKLKYEGLLETVEEYYNCDQQNRAEWLIRHDDPELQEILGASDNYDIAARLIGKKWETALARLGVSAAAAQE